jgi:hypothetical protein
LMVASLGISFLLVELSRNEPRHRAHETRNQVTMIYFHLDCKTFH